MKYPMTLTRSAALILLAAIFSGSAAADVYKCAQGGHVIYSDRPCPNAKTVDTTNAAAPDEADALRAQIRQLQDAARVSEKPAEPSERHLTECKRRIRDYNWTVATAAKYPNDQWWRNQVLSGYDELQTNCRDVLIPGPRP